MFKKLVPVVCLLTLAAGPVLAADTTPPAQDSSASTAKSTSTSTHKKHHKKSSKKSTSSSTDSSAPK